MGLLRTAEWYTCRKARDPSRPSLDFARNVYNSTQVMVSTPTTKTKGRYFVSSMLLGRLVRVAM